MNDRYECAKCHKQLFRGSLKLILTRAATPKDALEIKCPRCGELNTFVPEPTVLKTTRPAMVE